MRSDAAKGLQRYRSGPPITESSLRAFALPSGAVFVVDRVDITTLRLDAIVNAANERMLGGGGVDGAIHAAAGPELLQACRSVAEVRPGVRCPTGEARITPGFRLPARFVIHTVGPIYESAAISAPLLRRAWQRSLELARERNLSSVAFPAISCGVYGYPLDEAAAVSVQAVMDYAWNLREVVLAAFSDAVHDAFVDAAASRGLPEL